jgi:hypothetical protein
MMLQQHPILAVLFSGLAVPPRGVAPRVALPITGSAVAVGTGITQDVKCEAHEHQHVHVLPERRLRAPQINEAASR